MNNQVHTQIVSFIWSIADDCLRDVYVRGKYRDVILPMTVIRRLDAMLEGTIENVRNTKKLLDEAKVDNQWPALCNAAGQPFCNASPFLLKDLTSRASKQKLKTDFETYLDGFSPNVQEILEKFKFRNQIATMVDADILGSVIEKFVSSDINLSPNPVYKDDEKTILKHPGLDNHGMGTIFEELIRKFNEENNEEAGEHWTPRDVVELMADLIFIPIADQIKDATYTCYDGACGTGGMLTVAQDRLQTLATRRGKNVSIHLFGQEVQPETYAICKADMLLKGDGEQVEHIVYGSTLSADGNATRQFDFMLANPPYGKSWKVDAEKMGGKKEILDTRFNTYLEDGTEMKMIPRTSDVEDTESNHNFIPDDLSGYKVVKKGQFAMNKMKAWQGSYGISDYTGIVSPAYFIFDVAFDNLEYFHYAIRSKVYVNFFAQASDGIRVGQWDLQMDKMKEIPFIIPPADEQNVIVEHIKNTLPTYNNAIEKLTAEVEVLEEYKTKIIVDTVTGKIDVRDIEIPEYEFTEESADSDSEDADLDGDGEQED